MRKNQKKKKINVQKIVIIILILAMLGTTILAIFA